MWSPLIKPMFQSLIAHGKVTYLDLRDRLSLCEAAIIEDALVAEMETKRRAERAAKQQAENDAEHRSLQKGRR